MASQIEVFNMALSSIGVKARVSSPTQASREAEACALWYDTIVDQALAAAPWHFAERAARLAVLKERDFDVAWASDDPVPGYRFVYSQPSNLIRPHHLSTFRKFIAGIYDETKAILADEEDAILIYTIRDANTSHWDPTFTSTVISALAAHIAIPLSGKKDLAKMAMETANKFIVEARVAHANANFTPVDAVPDWIQARSYANNQPLEKYIYPFGALYTISGLM